MEGTEGRNRLLNECRS